MLRRIGNKSKIAKDIISHFPPHNMYIELFFGAGGLFFNKPLADHNIMNDIDNDVYNLYTVLQAEPEKLRYEIEIMPIHNSLFQYWVKNKETEPMKKAVRFLFLSNFSYLGMGKSLRLIAVNSKVQLLNGIDYTLKKLQNVMFTNEDFRNVLKKIAVRPKGSYVVDTPFIYCDPPYLGTTDNYSNSFKENDFIDLLDTLENFGHKWAISELDNDFIKETCKKYNIIKTKERRTLKSRSTEILITNYENGSSLF